MTFAKEGQDLFVSMLLPTPGFFLDIGCAEPKENNNTYLLEQLGWRGIMIDANQSAVSECLASRNSHCICADIRSIDFRNFLQALGAPKVIDYISLDVDHSNIEVIRNFPFDEYQFKIMTFETDKYSCGNERKNACIEALSSFTEYCILLEDGITQNLEWEDWWINQNFFSKNLLEISSKSMHWRLFLEKVQFYAENSIQSSG